MATALGIAGSGCADDGVGGVAGLDFDGEPEVVSYERQPMVVDIRVTATVEVSPADLSAGHASDPGVRFEVRAGEGPRRLVVRARGLSPGTEHSIDLELAGTSRTVAFETPAPLPGFVGAWAVTYGAGPPEPVFRIFDLTELPAAEISRVVAIDAAGVTRFFLGNETLETGPSAVRAGVHMRPDGSLLYLYGDAIRIVDELGDVQVKITAEQLGLPGLHHDVLERENGNLVAIAYSFRDVEYPGMGALHVAGDRIVEVTPEGQLVWEWDSFDHLDPLRVRDGFDFLVPDPDTGTDGHDWTHANGIVERDGRFYVSMRHQDWILAIERDTGELAWRLGPEGDFSLAEGQWFYHQHSPQWQPDGTLLLYDNGAGNPDLPDPQEATRVVRFAVDETEMVAREVWQDDEEGVKSIVGGDADRMPGGHLLVLDSSLLDPGGFYARLRELDPAQSPMRQWTVESAVGTFMYRAIASERLVGEAQN